MILHIKIVGITMFNVKMHLISVPSLQQKVSKQGWQHAFIIAKLKKYDFIHINVEKCREFNIGH